ncbi:DExH-box splicing factor binding site-domain-containing protein [Chytriomyces sp. MP71]|nr:DExH-box splicing factor binding site-domain-containing protein [Chytriomyces sp. MP71]
MSSVATTPSVKFSLKRRAPEPTPIPTSSASNAFSEASERRQRSRTDGESEEAVTEIDEGFGVAKPKPKLVIPLVKVNAWKSDGLPVAVPVQMEDVSTAHVEVRPEATAHGDQPILADYQSTGSDVVMDASDANRPSPSSSTVSNLSSILSGKKDRSAKWGLQLRGKSTLSVGMSSDSLAVSSVAEAAFESQAVLEPVADTRTLEERAIAQLLQESTFPRPEVLPILQQNAVPGIRAIQDPKEKYLFDVSLRPEEATLQDFEEVPIEDFGLAMLRGMGYNDEDENGSKKKEDFVFSKPRPNLLGLGAEPPKPPSMAFKDKKGSSSGGNNGKREDWERKDNRDSGDNDQKSSSIFSSREQKYASGRKVKILKEGEYFGLLGTIASCKSKVDGLALKVKVKNSRGREDEMRCWTDQVQLI